MAELTYEKSVETLINYFEQVDWLYDILKTCVDELEDAVQNSATDTEWSADRIAVYNLLPNDSDLLGNQFELLKQCLIFIADVAGIQTNPTADILDDNRPVVEWNYNEVSISQYVATPTVLYNILYNTTYSSFSIELHNNRKYLTNAISEAKDCLGYWANLPEAIRSFIEYANGLQGSDSMGSKGLSPKTNINQQEAVTRIQDYVINVDGFFNLLLTAKNNLGVVYSKATSQDQWVEACNLIKSDISRVEGEINAPLKNLRDPFILLANGAFLTVEESFDRNPNLPIIVDWDYYGVDICQYILTPSTIVYVLTLLTNGVRNIEIKADDKWIGQVLREVLPDLFIQWKNMNKAVANFIAEAKYEAFRSLKLDKGG
jgi:hypothetical protein